MYNEMKAAVGKRAVARREPVLHRHCATTWTWEQRIVSGTQSVEAKVYPRSTRRTLDLAHRFVMLVTFCREDAVLTTTFLQLAFLVRPSFQ